MSQALFEAARDGRRRDDPAAPGRRWRSLTATDQHGQTALHWAVRSGHAGIVRQLLAAGSPVDARDADGNTPLHRAVQAGKREIAQALLAAEADVNAATRFGHSPLAPGSRGQAGGAGRSSGRLRCRRGGPDRRRPAEPAPAPGRGGRAAWPGGADSSTAAPISRRGTPTARRHSTWPRPRISPPALHQGHRAVAALLRAQAASRGGGVPESLSSRGFPGRVIPGRNGQAGPARGGAWDRRGSSQERCTVSGCQDSGGEVIGAETARISARRPRLGFFGAWAAAKDLPQPVFLMLNSRCVPSSSTTSKPQDSSPSSSASGGK